ncbi:hypothetical protein GH714_033345 [Hevea brasiliensis]|uniref:Homeobox domain-containing protein n=1 Tax=Hevea brasiliensis TaxID=3981 RepID=A0A6A6NKC6_HEVBR|nr:hypothetical protein GH714_033345 [Hevea brasiliensis]
MKAVRDGVRFFKECPHPDDNQRRQLSKELGLEPRQIKFWFQNKRTQTKTQNEKADNSVLRAENERIQCENLAIREALKNVICPSCGGPPFGEEERQRSLQKLQLENAQLKEEMDSIIPIHRSSLDFSMTGLANQRMGSPALDLELNPGISDHIPMPYQQLEGIPEMEKTLMTETAARAMEELIRLLRINEPLWIRSQSDGRYTIHRDSYDKVFPRAHHFKGSNARVESSKDSGMVTMNGMNLVEMFLDTNKWVDLFPTIVTRASIIQVLETGLIGNRSGSLQLMYEQMHILSPLVPSREFCFLRQCQQIEADTWVIADVSYDCLKENGFSSRSWRLPSGCMIQDMPNGCSKVTWVEHVEVDDKTKIHRLYRDLISSDSAYGAERWIFTLQRMCERYAFSFGETAPSWELGGVMTSSEGRKSIMKLAHRMVKNFCSMLSMSGKLDFPQLSEVKNSGVRVSVRKSMETGQPGGMIWDILSNGNPVHEIAHISGGAHPGNCISIIRPFIPSENNMVMLQESCTDPLGSFIVYAPIDIPTMNIAISGEDSSIIPILPSGFVISGDGRPDKGNGASTSANPGRSSGGSLLTVAFQILVSTPTSSSSSSSSKELNIESVATVNTLISSTVQKIKAALNCSNLD